MIGIVFLSTIPEMGALHATGPVTGMEYDITPTGTPVAEIDAAGLLTVLGDPCCGRPLPLGGKIKLFHKMVPSGAQVASIPEELVMQVSIATIKSLIPVDPIRPPKRSTRIEKTKVEEE